MQAIGESRRNKIADRFDLPLASDSRLGRGKDQATRCKPSVKAAGTKLLIALTCRLHLTAGSAGAKTKRPDANHR